MKKSLKFLLDSNYRLPLFILGFFWLLLQLFLFKHFGIVTGFESTKYIEQAHNLLETGKYSSGNFLFYSTEILLIALCLKLQWNFIVIVIIQCLLNALSVFLFLKLVLKFTNSKYIAFFITLLFLCMFYYHLYNVHLFTESLYFSFSIIYTYFLFNIRKIKWQSIFFILLGLTLLYFTRPTGIFFIPATLLYIVIKFFRDKALLIIMAFIALVALISYSLLNFALQSGGEYDFLLPYLSEQIICGVPTIHKFHNISIPVEKNSLEGLAYIIKHYSGLFFRLAKERWLTFFGVIRPYYSKVHNIFIAVYFYSIYCFILLNIYKLFHEYLSETIFMICIITTTALTVILSCDEWHNRFILSIFPFLLLLASPFFVKLKERFS